MSPAVWASKVTSLSKKEPTHVRTASTTSGAPSHNDDSEHLLTELYLTFDDDKKVFTCLDFVGRVMCV